MGYVGAVLVRHLRKVMPDATLVGYDTGYFKDSLIPGVEPPEQLLQQQIIGDVRDLNESHLEKVDGVIHLAAISNDPMGSRFEQVTDEINFRAGANLARLAVSQGVRSFVFASSCSLYGFAEGGPRKEGDPLNPLTAYAKSKAAMEKFLASMNHRSTTFTCLRFATACGASDRLRLDLVLNDFVASAVSEKIITIMSDGTPWRPLIDVRDMARAMEWALTRHDKNPGPFLSVNVGTNSWNFQVRDLAEAVAKEIPGCSISVNSSATPDRRSYRVDFSLFQNLAPHHQPGALLPETIQGLKASLHHAFPQGKIHKDSFLRLKILERKLSLGVLDQALRQKVPPEFSFN